MSKKYFVADLDGTLIYKQKSYLHPALEEEEAVRNFTAEGHEFFIATGRMLPDVQRVMKNLGINSPYVISQNGAYIYKNGKEIRSTNLSQDQIRALMGLIIDEWKYKPEYITMTTSDFSSHMKVYTYKGWGLKRYFKRRKSDASAIKTWRNSTFRSIEKDGVKIARLLVAYHNADKLLEMEAKLQETFGNKLSIYMSGKYSLEICAAGVSKARAIRYIMETESIPEDKIAFVGDSGNDYCVFDDLPNTYVMAHANDRYKHPESKVVARVAEAIKDFSHHKGETQDEE